MRLTAGQQFRSDRAPRLPSSTTPDPFFAANKCARCPNELIARIMSWFNNDTICLECSAKEGGIKKALRAKGIDGAMEGCGYVPDPEKL